MSLPPYKSLIASRRTEIAFFEINHNFDKEGIDQSEYKEDVVPISDPENRDNTVAIGIRIQVPDRKLMPTDGDSESEEAQYEELNTPFFVIFKITFFLHDPIAKGEGYSDLLNKAYIESTVRARIAVADFIYHCGGHEAREKFIMLQREAVNYHH